MTPLSSIYTDLDFLLAFRRDAKGSWSALRPVSVGGVTLEAGFTFSHDVTLGGLDLAVLLHALADKYPQAVRT